MCLQGIYESFYNFLGDSRVRHKSDAAFGENNNKSSNSQVLTKILNYELIQKNQGCIIGSIQKVLRHSVFSSPSKKWLSKMCLQGIYESFYNFLGDSHEAQK